MSEHHLSPVPPLQEGDFADRQGWQRWIATLRRRVLASIADLSVSLSNGFAGSVSTSGQTSAVLTLEVAVSGMLKGAPPALVTATPGTDYMPNTTIDSANGLAGAVTVHDATSATVALRTTVTGMVKGNGTALSAAVPGTDYALPSKYAHFHDTTTQTAAAATRTAITFNTTILSNGFTIGSPASRIVASTTGLYRLHFSLQFDNPSGSSDNVTVWEVVNGTDLSYSGSLSEVPQKHGAVNGAICLSRTDLIQLTAGDYLELYWSTDTGNSSLMSYPVGAAPVHPASPGAVLTLQQIT